MNVKVPREVLKASGFALGFQHFPWESGPCMLNKIENHI